MSALPDGEDGPASLSRTFSPEEVTMDLTTCGLLPARAEEVARLYREHGNWNQVKQVWLKERRANRSTKGSAQKLYRILSGRFKNAPASLPNARDLPIVLDTCSSSRHKSQALYLYLIINDPLVRYAVHEYIQRLSEDYPEPLDFANETLTAVLNQFEYADGTAFDYADSTTKRWCEGFRSVMREIGVLEGQQTVVGTPPTLGETPLLIAMDYSYQEGGEEWFTSPMGLQYLFQPNARWDELYDRAAETEAWEFVELHGSVRLQPVDEPYSWIPTEGAE
jgi:hypothetical protein